MDANDLARWTRFAAKGGIGVCTALQDCVAQGADDLMFLKDDEVVVLLQLPQEDQYLGYCEGVVGRFHGSAVRFHGKLKKPVFAKRQSAVGSPSRPMSLSPLSPSSSSMSASNSKPVSSPGSSPRIPSLSSLPASDARPLQPARISVSSVSPSSARRPGPSHSRTPSTTSSSSHYSTHSQPSSRLPEPMPINTHARTPSTGSSHSEPASALLGPDPDSEDAQRVSLPAKPSSTATTPVLTDASSAQSSFTLTPTPALPAFLPAGRTVPASLFHGRSRSGFEKLSPREETRNTKKRVDSEDSLIQVRRVVEERFSAAEVDAMQAVVLEEAPRLKDEFPTGESETSVNSVSVYSEASALHADDQSETATLLTERSIRQRDHDILQEDESDEQLSQDGDRATSMSGLSDLSDGGFGIGMTLLREDEDDSEDDGNDGKQAQIGGVPTKDYRSSKASRKVGMRVMNPGSASPSTSGSDGGAEDDTVLPSSQSQFHSVSMSASTIVSDFPASLSSDTVVSRLAPLAPVPSPRLASPTALASRPTSSIAPTEDEHWESDADIYDDYRYSRYSSHSPAQHSSKRASRASSKSARSRASERPPLPDEEAWRRGGDEGTSLPKSMASERPRNSSDTGIETRPRDQPATSSKRRTSSSLGVESSVDNTTVRDMPISGQPTILQNVAETPKVARPSVASKAMSVTSPLTRAFRQSDVSMYSRESQENDGQEADVETTRNSEEITTFSTPRHPSPRPERSQVEEGRSTRSISPALASSLREKIQNELRSKSPNMSSTSVLQPHLSILTSRSEDENNVIVLNESPVSNESPSPGLPDASHLRVATPQSFAGSAPPSPLNPGYPPSPSTMASFPTTAPLTINKSPLPSPSAPRQPISPPAIPFIGVPPPGRPPTHMQYAQRQPYHSQFSQLNTDQEWLPTSESLHSTLRLAGQQRANTIHGHVQKDLLTSTGPVPISFMLPGMLPPQPPPGALPRPQPSTPPSPYGHLPPQNQNRTQSPVPESQSPAPPSPQQQRPPLAAERPRRMTAPAPTPGTKSFLNANSPSPTNSPSPDAYRTNHAQRAPPDGGSMEQPPSSSGAAPLPRANFFPKVGQVRPRSRSFSGFNSEITEKISQSLGRRSQEEGSQPFKPSTGMSRLGFFSSKTQPQALAPSPIMGPTRGKAGQASRPAHGPSPLSLPPTTSKSPSSSSTPHVNVPPSPVAPSAGSDNHDPYAKRNTLRKMPSHTSLRHTQAATSGPSSVTFPQPRRRTSGSSGTYPTYDDDSLRPPSPLKSSAVRQSHDSDRTQTSFSHSEISTPSPIANVTPSSSPLVPSTSLRSKISMSALRGKGPPRNAREGASETPSSTNGPATPSDEETVQIRDMEFELVRPVVVHGSSDLHRNDDGVDLKDGTNRPADLRRDSSSVHSGALSPGGLSPSTDVRPGAASASEASNSNRRGRAVEVNNSVQAHRDRELKWMSTINSGDAAQARKSKKIKKLLIDGVPSSVRYLVWAHLSNSQSKKMPNVYTQLSKRRPALARDIERDVGQSFPDHQHLRDPNGPLVSVLYAYIAMVPDLRYHRGLAIIAGNLLLQSPEEDAFWTFLAMMDSHLRPYFMPASPQLGVDTSLFIKAAEAADPQLAKRVFAELNVRPQDLCGVWFSSVFAGTLPLGHLHRVWDLFFYEGVSFLFRVGLTILSLSRHHLMESPKGSPTSYTGYLLRPPPEVLPEDPEQFISQALLAKLKDDDMRKMRLKMTEAASKQHRAPRMSTLQPSHHHPASR